MKSSKKKVLNEVRRVESRVQEVKETHHRNYQVYKFGANRSERWCPSVNEFIHEN